jgi:hypothetical protein
MTDLITFDALADSFANGAESISEFIRSSMGEEATRSSIQEKISEQLHTLNWYARVIYKTWDQLGFLRRAELGLGITLFLNLPGRESTPMSIVGFEGQRPKLAPCAFEGWFKNDKLVGNYEIFANFIKGWPLIFTDEENKGRVVCYVEGPSPDGRNCGILAQDPEGTDHFHVWHNVPRDKLTGGDGSPGRYPIFFDRAPEDDDFAIVELGKGLGREHLHGKINPRDSRLWDESNVRLWPIPYEAARGIKWSGQSMATGDGTLGGQLAALAKTLGATKRWSFDSDYWEGRSLGDDGRLRVQRINPSYVGLIEEPKNIFRRRDLTATEVERETRASVPVG